MRTLLPFILGLGMLLGLAMLLLVAFHNWAYKAGFRAGKNAGYLAGVESGRREADNWWLGVESGADRARQEIWRKEAQL